MNKKGNAYVIGIIALTIVIIFLANVLIPQVKQSTNSISATQSLVYTNSSRNQNFTITNTPMVNGELSISGLTLTINYTVDYTNGFVTIKTPTVNTTYTASYNYYGANYLTNIGERSLFAVIILAGIIGAVYSVFRIFNLV